MSEGLGNRLTSLRTSRGWASRELAVMAGIPYAELLALESGARRRLSPEAVRRLTDLFNTTPDYLLDGREPTPSALRHGFFRYYDGLSAEAREHLKFAPIQTRMEAVLEYLARSYPTLLAHSQVAARLGLSPEALDDVLQSRAPLQSRLLRLLSGMVGLTMDFLVRGDFFGGVVEAEQGLAPDLLSQYYQVVQEAIAAGITPGALRKAVQILASKDQEESP